MSLCEGVACLLLAGVRPRDLSRSKMTKCYGNAVQFVFASLDDERLRERPSRPTAAAAAMVDHAANGTEFNLNCLGVCYSSCLV